MSFVASWILYSVPSRVLTKAGPAGSILALLFFSLASPLAPLTFSSSDLIIVQGAYKCLQLKRSESTPPSPSPFVFLFDGVLNGVIVLPELSFSSMINKGSKKYSTVVLPVTYLEELKVDCCESAIKTNL